MFDQVLLGVSDHWPNLAGVAVCGVLIAIAIYLLKERRIRGLRDRSYVNVIDRRFSIIALAGLLWPIAAFFMTLWSSTNSISISDTLFLEAGAFLLVGGFYPVVIALTGPKPPRLLAKSAELVAHYWILLAILLALLFAFAGTLSLSYENHRREARLLDLQRDDENLKRASRTSADDVGSLNEKVDQQGRRITELEKTVDDLPNEAKSLTETVDNLRLDLDAMQKKHDQRINDLAGQVSDLCKALANLQSTIPTRRQKTTTKLPPC